MSTNLLETVQQNLGYPSLQKIDTSTDQIKENSKTPDEHKFSQAAIPAVLTAMYSFAQSDDGAKDLLQKDPTSNWVKFIFDDNSKKAINTIAEYAGLSLESSIIKINTIASEAVKVIRENLTEDAEAKEVKQYFGSQKTNILLYLLPNLNIGGLLHDDTLDDKTNKMEGPVSSLINSIGSVFSTPVTENEIKEK